MYSQIMKNLGLMAYSNRHVDNRIIITVVLSNLRWDRDLAYTLGAHNSKTVSQKNLMRVQLEPPS